MPEKAAKQPQPGPPALPFKTFLNFIDWLGEVGVPQKIAREFWSKKLAGNMGPLVIGALRFFDLIDENSHSKAELDAIATSPEKRKEFFKKQVNDRYGTVLKSVDLARATRGQLSEEFGKVFGIRGSMIVKSVIFFVHMARYAGFNVSSHIIIRERSEPSRPRKKKSADDTKTNDTAKGLPVPKRDESSIGGDHADAQESLLLWGLFKRLPKPQTVWAPEDRKRWLDTLQNVIGLEYRDS